MSSTEIVVAPRWCAGLPTVSDGNVLVREVETGDAPSLLAMLNSEGVTRFISPPPTTIEGFERFVLWTRGERAHGRYTTFAVVPVAIEKAIGVIQLREHEPGFGTAEWGFALGSEFWGSGVFEHAARLVMNFAFSTVGVHRLEARSVVTNGRGNGALRKLGATCEGLLRRSFVKNGEYLDQHLWSILDADWRGRGGRSSLAAEGPAPR